MKTYVTKKHWLRTKADLADRAERIADQLVPEAVNVIGKVPNHLADRWNSVYWETLNELNAQADISDMAVPSDRLLPNAIRRANREYPQLKAWNLINPQGNLIPPPDEMIDKWERLVEQRHKDACQLAGLVL